MTATNSSRPAYYPARPLTRPLALPEQTPERTYAVELLAHTAVELESEAETRRTGQHDHTVRTELLRAAQALRFVAALIVRGGMDPDAWTFWCVVAADFLALVKRADHRGVIV